MPYFLVGMQKFWYSLQIMILMLKLKLLMGEFAKDLT